MQKPTIPGPDPDTRTPKFKLPALACDAHTHIFGPGDKYPYAPGRPYTPPDAPLGDFRALHRKLGIGRAVIVNASVHGTDNRVVEVNDVGRLQELRMVPDIDDGITERGLRELHDGGFRGCRFNFVRHLGGVPDMAVFHRIVAMVAPLGWHIDLHFDAIDLPEDDAEENNLSAKPEDFDNHPEQEVRLETHLADKRVAQHDGIDFDVTAHHLFLSLTYRRSQPPLA